jgi:hypothetical protein
MRSLLLTLVLGLGALGLSLATPNQVRANDFRSPAIYSGSTPVAYYWRGGTRWRGFYPGWEFTVATTRMVLASIAGIVAITPATTEVITPGAATGAIMPRMGASTGARACTGKPLP